MINLDNRDIAQESGKMLLGDGGAVQIRYPDESFWRFDGPYEGLPVGNITDVLFESAGQPTQDVSLDMIELEDENMQFWVSSLYGLSFYDGKNLGTEFYKKIKK